MEDEDDVVPAGESPNSLVAAVRWLSHRDEQASVGDMAPAHASSPSASVHSHLREYLGFSVTVLDVLPLGHAAFGVLCYATVLVLSRRKLESNKSLVLVLGATQLPDLIDKPLVFYGILSSGRAAGHSILGATIVCGCFVLGSGWVKRRTTRAADSMQWLGPLPFVIGYVSHLIADSYTLILTGRWGELSYLLWPLLSPPQYPSDLIAPWVRLQRIYLEGGIHPQWEVILLAMVLYAVVALKHKGK